MANRRALLVTGASGFLGWHLCRAAAGAFDVIAVANAHPIDIPGTRAARCDLTDPACVARLIDECAPDAFMHLAAVSQPNYCQEHEAQSRKVNVDAAVRLAAACGQLAIPFVFTSTDLVFDGRSPPYRESDPVSPVSAYGRQKADAERGIREAYGEATICRMPLMFGRSGPNSRNFLQAWTTRIRDGQPVDAFTDEYRTPVSGRIAARGLVRALEAPGELLNMGGEERISRHAMGKLLARLLGCSERLVKPVRQREVTMAAPRPPDVSLDSRKAGEMLGYATPGVEEMLSDELRGEE